MTQHQIEVAAKRGRGTITRWLDRDEPPNREMLRTVAAVLSVDADWLATGERAEVPRGAAALERALDDYTWPSDFEVRAIVAAVALLRDQVRTDPSLAETTTSMWRHQIGLELQKAKASSHISDRPKSGIKVKTEQAEQAKPKSRR